MSVYYRTACLWLALLALPSSGKRVQNHQDVLQSVRESQNATHEPPQWIDGIMASVSKATDQVGKDLAKLVSPDTMPLTMTKCTSDIGSMKIGIVSVECEELATASQKTAYHCGLKVQAEANPQIARRYDLGPRPFQLTWNPLDIAAVAIECTEAPHLHGSDNGTAQIPWSTAPPATAVRQSTFNEFEQFIRTRRVVGTHYDVVGGNCQHFSFRMYEILMKKPCYSIKVPNSDSIAEVLRMASNKEFAAAFADALKKNSEAFQADQRVPTLKNCEK
jgi:hypothetical protein